MTTEIRTPNKLAVTKPPTAASLTIGTAPLPVSATFTTFDSMAQAFGAPEGKIMLLYGDRELFRFSMLLVAQSVYACLPDHLSGQGLPDHLLGRGLPDRLSGRGTRSNKPTALIDGCNRFDLHAVTRFARERSVDPQLLLQRLFISRGFTCYQMEAAVTTKLQAFFGKTGASRAFVFGLLDTFYDEQAPIREVQQILVRVLRAFDQMKRQNISLLLSCTEWNVLPEERNRLLGKLKHNADAVYHLAPNESGQLQLFGEKLPPPNLAATNTNMILPVCISPLS